MSSGKAKVHFRDVYSLERHRARLIRIGIDPRELEVKYDLTTGKLFLLVPSTVPVRLKAQITMKK